MNTEYGEQIRIGIEDALCDVDNIVTDIEMSAWRIGTNLRDPRNLKSIYQDLDEILRDANWIRNYCRGTYKGEATNEQRDGRRYRL